MLLIQAFFEPSKDINFITRYTYGENQVRIVEVNSKNTNVVFESPDNDEGVIMCGGKYFNENFDVNQEGDHLYINSKAQSDSHAEEVTFMLPLYFENKVSFIVKVKDANVDFTRKVNLEDISCEVVNGDITGESLKANKAVLKVDSAHEVLLKEIDAKEEVIGNI